MSVFDIPVPEDQLFQEPAPFKLPKPGWYKAALTGAERKDSERSDWVGVQTDWDSFGTLDGSESDVTRLNERRYQVTLEMPSNTQAEEIGARQATELAIALGIDVDRHLPPVDSSDEFIEMVAACAGTECQVRLAHQVRRDFATKQPVTDDDGRPIKDVVIKAVKPLEES